MTDPFVRKPSRRAHRILRAHPSDSCPLALLWSFRLMVDLQGYRKLLRRNEIADDDVAEALGLGDWVDNDDYRPAPAAQQLRQEYLAFCAEHANPAFPEPLASNLRAMANLIGLNATETTLLGFCVLMQCDTILHRSIEVLHELSYNQLPAALARVLELPVAAVEEALSHEGRLFVCGVLERGSRPGMDVSQILTFSSHDLLNQLRFHRGAAQELFKHSFRRSRRSVLERSDYQHMGVIVDDTLGYLRKATARKSRGVNILLYGPPGTGKTELCRLFAESLSLELYEIACNDSEGDPIGGTQRLSALRSAMGVLQGTQALVMLDEIEDIFAADFGPGRKTQRSHKGWINRMLEENSQPCFWLTNSIDCLDSAYIRRFDIVIETPNPGRAQRERIIRKLGGERLSDEMIATLASHETLTPAVFERALRVARTIHPRANHKLEASLEGLLDGTLKAQGHTPLSRQQANARPTLYTPELLNADTALTELATGLRRHPQARLCFYGPPGTGKTAFAGWLAEQLGKPLHSKRVSDLVAPYVGQTEQNLAEAFRQAEEEEAVLLLDEVDSFLQDRTKARAQWEVTAVNEMLTQMESFSGLFIASTNLMDNLDEASLRRFDCKIHFDYLLPQQSRTLLRAHLEELGLDDPAQAAEARVASLNRLAPGDFAAVRRRARFKPLASADEFVQALGREIALKKGGQQRPIGFVH